MSAPQVNMIFVAELLERSTARRSQAHLRRRDRLASAPGSFWTRVRAEGGEKERRRSVLLVDDVVTTGATAAACATTLEEADVLRRTRP